MALQHSTRPRLTLLLAALALLAAFWIATRDLARESLWDDEAYTLWFIQDENRSPEGPAAILQFARTSLLSALARVRADVHPPLYFLALDIWNWLSGRSVFAVRLFSTLVAMIALAGVYALGKLLFDRAAGLLALLLLGTASFFVYYTREARMYTLLLALAVLLFWAYGRWRRLPTRRRTIILGVIAAALLYTHYYAVLLIAVLTVHGAAAAVAAEKAQRKTRLASLLAALALAALLYFPWMPTLVAQIRAQGGPAGLPVASDWNTLAALVLIFTSGHWGLFAALFVFGLWGRLRQNASTLMLLLAWLIFPTAALLALNAWVRPLFQVRYTLMTLPAWALLAASGFRFMVQPVFLKQNGKKAARGAAALVFTWLIYSQLAVYSDLWPAKPRWEEAVRQAAQIRQPLEPALTSLAPSNPAAYYDQIYHLRRGITLDLAWRWQESADMERYAAHTAGAPRVWMVLPSHYAATWDALNALLPGRHVGYRDSVMEMIFYRFDKGEGDQLRFQFGGVLAYKGGIGHRLFAAAGHPFCFQTAFVALEPVTSSYQVDFQLTQGYNTRRAGVSEMLPALDTGIAHTLSPCIAVPPGSPAGPHHLRLSVRDPQSGQELPLIEDGRLYWGTQLIMAQVSVAPA